MAYGTVGGSSSWSKDDRLLVDSQPQDNKPSANSRPKALLSEVEGLFVGLLGGALETLLLMPLVTWKLYRQAGIPKPRSFRHLYTGTTIQAAQVAPIQAAQVLTCGLLEKHFFGATDLKRARIEHQLLSGFVSGALSALAITPMEMIIIQQTRLGLGSLQTAQHVICNHGPQSLWRGLGATTARAAVCCTGSLGLTPIISSYLSSVTVGGERPFPSSVCWMVGSSLSGTAAAVMSHPVDTAKTLVQADIAGGHSRSAWHAAWQLMRKDGPRALFRGIAPRALRLCCSSYVINSVREAAISIKTQTHYGIIIEPIWRHQAVTAQTQHVQHVARAL